jgi:hypothetical protein
MEHATENHSNGLGHETREVDVRFIFVSLAALLIGAFLACLLVVGIFQYFHHTYLPEAVKASPQVIPPEPRIEVNTTQQLRTVRAREDHVLSSYAIVDQKQGLVRVPIDRAIDMLAQKGLPSHDYLSDLLGGKKPPVPTKPPEPKKTQGSSNGK